MITSTPPTRAPYGSWTSPISLDLLLAGSVSLGQVEVEGETIYWIEGRPLEGGRNVIVRRTAGGAISDVTPAPYNARTRVHEYGGGNYLVHDGLVIFSNFADQRLYAHRPDEAPQPITPEDRLRYADMVMDAPRGRLIAVREDHRGDGEAVNTLVAIPLNGGPQEVLVAGSDFYATPRLSPNGRQLAWLAWDHPNMPWDGTALYLAELDGDGALSHPRVIAGGRLESIFQPEWSPDGALTFVSDRTDWWNLYQFSDGRIEAVYPMAAEFGMPQWVFGQRTYGYASPETIICAYVQDGRVVMASLDIAAGRLTPLDVPYAVEYPSYGSLQVGANAAIYIGVSPTDPTAVVRLDLATGAHEVLRRSSTIDIDDGYLSVAQPIEYPTTGDRTAYAYYYPPRNRDFVAPDGELPPLIVTGHGGPTSAARPALDLSRMYWTSRGFAVLDVNYGGSTGFGRPYRQRLNGNWGVVDVEDCISGARYLVAQGLADGDRLAIKGGSAGGYTTLSAIVFHDVFQAASSWFGVSDAEALATDTHKFESRYLDSLIGPYPAMREVYYGRSPIHFADRISAALILFQGLDDEVVPPNQSEAMYRAAAAQGAPVAYVAFEGEGHGFRQAPNIKRAIEGELYFFGRVFGFEPADAIEPVAIRNLDETSEV
jgi:dipeptidyl aminopeptidase/acylaminoacyl peptidase